MPHQFPISDYNSYKELPLDHFNSMNYSVYLINFDWEYIFVNKFVKRNLGKRANGMEGENMWIKFPDLTSDSQFIKMKKEI